MTDLDDLITSGLQRRADVVPTSRTPVAEIAYRARMVRRARRQHAVAGAAVAVLAVAGVTVSLDQGNDGRPLPAVISSPSPSPSSAPSTSPAPAPLSDLPTGPSPGIGYVQGSVYLAPDGARTTVPTTYGVSAVTPYDGGVFVNDTRAFEGTVGMELVTDRGVQDVGDGCTTGSVAVSRDGTRAAWVTFGCPESMDTAPTVLHQIVGGRRTDRTLDAGVAQAMQSPIGYLGDDLVVSVGYIGGVLVMGADGSSRTLPDLVGGDDLDPGSGAVVGRLADDPSTAEDDRAAVVDDDGIRWQRPGLYVSAFSPDGSMVLAIEDGRWVVLDARDGSEVARLGTLLDAATRQVVWEDDTHVLGVVARGGSTAIVRSNLDGRVELASELLPDPGDGYGPFTLAD